MTDLFASAKKKGTVKKSAASKEKMRVEVAPEFFSTIEEISDLQSKAKAIKAKTDILMSELKEEGKSKWIDTMKENGKNPGSFMLATENEAGDIAQAMFVPKDAYIKIDEERAEELVENYGEEIVEEETTFKFNAKMLAKYGSVISQMIMESEDIKESDKAKIIEAETTYKVAKGTVEKLDKFGEDVETMVEEVRPIFAINKPEVIKA